MALINRGVVWLSVQRVTSSLFVRFPWLVISAVCLVFVFNQVKFEGFTGSVQFDDSGERTQISLEILNLRNSSFQKVRNTVDRIKDYCSVLIWSCPTLKYSLIRSGSTRTQNKRQTSKLSSKLPRLI